MILATKNVRFASEFPAAGRAPWNIKYVTAICTAMATPIASKRANALFPNFIRLEPRSVAYPYAHATLRMARARPALIVQNVAAQRVRREGPTPT